MWLFELVLLSLVVGVPLGIGLRIWDEWQEKAKTEAAQKAQRAQEEATTPVE